MLLALPRESPSVFVLRRCMSDHTTKSEIAEAQLYAPIVPIFLLIEDAKNRTITVVLQVYNMVRPPLYNMMSSPG
jgi:hypothetical protein